MSLTMVGGREDVTSERFARRLRVFVMFNFLHGDRDSVVAKEEKHKHDRDSAARTKSKAKPQRKIARPDLAK